MSFRCRYAIIILLACSSSLQAQPSAVKLTSTSVQAGQNAEVTGTGLNAVTAVLLKSSGKTDLSPTIVSKTDTALSFTVPANTAAGSYTVALTPAPAGTAILTLTVTAAPAPPPAPAPAPAVASPSPAPVIDSVFPAAPFPTRQRFNFDINGSNFSPTPDKNTINVEGPGDVQFQHREATGGCQQYLENPDKLPCLEASADGRRLSVFGFPRPHAYQGPIKVRVLVNGVASDLKPFTLSRVNHRIVMAATIAVFALLVLIVYGLVSRGIQPYVIAGTKYSPLSAFLIDKETNSYSLSKFQLLAFSLVWFFAYIYVFLCRTLVQWNFQLPDIPDNYPTLLAVSVGTTAAAAGLSSIRGTKGAGPVLPSAADLICNGGMVVADRFQFFVWTLIACLGFVALVLMQDPATLQGFPTFPSGLLYVMGVSAAGYLGGKAARNPGPVLKNVNVEISTANNKNLSVTLLGSNLDKKAAFRIDGQSQSVAPPAAGTTPAGAPAAPVSGIPQAGAPTDYCTQLDFELDRAAGFATGDHTFEITNADGLGAQALFTGTPMKITPQGAVNTGTGPVSVVIKIENYRDKSTAHWQAPGTAAAQDLPNPQFTAATNEVTVSLIPGTQPGTGTLTFQTPIGATETCSLEVKNP